MQNIKPIIAKNIIDLRQKYNMTQIELAQKLNYSDKAISKWERAESVPDISVLKSIAEIFNVTLDYLVQEEHSENKPEQTPIINDTNDTNDTDYDEVKANKIRNHGFITGMAILLVWFIATLVYMIIDTIPNAVKIHWLAFVYAVPVSLTVWLVLNTIWFNKRRNFFIISLLMWSVLTCVFITCMINGINLPLVFTLGIPGQIIILLWSQLKQIPNIVAHVRQTNGNEKDNTDI
ncbi:MAG: helix-turn-helix domain-containing protein [Acutalibacteraceae bacterium]